MENTMSLYFVKLLIIRTIVFTVCVMISSSTRTRIAFKVYLGQCVQILIKVASNYHHANTTSGSFTTSPIVISHLLTVSTGRICRYFKRIKRKSSRRIRKWRSTSVKFTLALYRSMGRN